MERMKSEREKKEEERRRAKERRRQKLEKHRRLQEAWLTLRWIAEYIKDNKELWEFERLEREVERRRQGESWEKSKRFEKIAFLREKSRREKEEVGVERISTTSQSWC